MVKCGPKPPAPTKRELEKAEKEAKRLADAESGVKPAPLGEPRTKLIRLLHVPIRKKKRRVKSTDPVAIEESKRRRAKKEERSLARKNTKEKMKAFFERLTSGSHISGTATICPVDIDTLGTVSSGGTPTVGSPMLEAPITHTPGLSGYEHDSGTASSASSPKLGWSSLITRLSGKPVDLDTALTSPGALKPEQNLNNSPVAEASSPDTATPRLSLDFADNSTASSFFFGTQTFVSGPSCAVESPKTPQGAEVLHLSPEGQQESIPSQPQLSTISVDHINQGSEPRTSPSRFSLRPPSWTRPLSKSAIFSEPLDYTKYSSRSPSGTWSSQRSQSELVSEHVGEDILAIVSSFQDLSLGSNVSDTSSFLSPRLPEQDLVQPNEPLSGHTGLPGPRDMHAIKLTRVLEKQRVAGPDIHVATNVPPFCAHGSSSEDRVLAALGHTKRSQRVYDHVRPGHLVAGEREINTISSADCTPVMSLSAYNQATGVQSLVTPSYAGGSGRLVNSNSFSSNISSALGSELLGGVKQGMDSTNGPQSSTPSSPNVTLRPLAPAAPIVPKAKPSRWRSPERNTGVLQFDVFNDLERGMYNVDLDAYEAAEETSPALSTSFGDEFATWPYTPPLGSRSGIIPPTGTPVSRSPLAYAISLEPAPWGRSQILPMYGPHAAETDTREAGGMKGFVSALKWALKRTFGYFWQRRG